MDVLATTTLTLLPGAYVRTYTANVNLALLWHSNCCAWLHAVIYIRTYKTLFAKWYMHFHVPIQKPLPRRNNKLRMSEMRQRGRFEYNRHVQRFYKLFWCS